jgi:hypothetical protein
MRSRYNVMGYNNRGRNSDNDYRKEKQSVDAIVGFIVKVKNWCRDKSRYNEDGDRDYFMNDSVSHCVCIRSRFRDEWRRTCWRCCANFWKYETKCAPFMFPNYGARCVTRQAGPEIVYDFGARVRPGIATFYANPVFHVLRGRICVARWFHLFLCRTIGGSKKPIPMKSTPPLVAP